MKVIIFVTQLEAGGAQRAAFSLCKELRNKGYTAKMVFFYPKMKSFEDEEFDLLLRRRPRFKDIVPLLIRLFKYIKKENPTTIITFTYYSNIIVQLVAYLLKVPNRIASQRNPVSSYPKLARYVDLILGSTGVYTHNVMVSDSVLRSFRKYPLRYTNKASVIYNGVKSHQHYNYDKIILREELCLPRDVFILTNVGRLSHQKNQSFLIELIRDMDGVLLLIIGAGDLHEVLLTQSKGCEQKVQFFGQLCEHDVRRYLLASDLFVFPSLYEGQSNALLEAMSLGLPIMASDIPEQVEVLFSGEKWFGLALSTAQINEWRGMIQTIIGRPDLKLEYSKRSLERIANFSLERMVTQFEILMRSGR